MSNRRSDAEYAELQTAFEAGDWHPIGEPTEGVGSRITLKGGRPAGRKSPAGNTPTTSVRLPADIKASLDRQADIENVKPAEIIRRAIVEYIDRHPA